MKIPAIAYVEFGKDIFKPVVVRLKVKEASEVFDLNQLKDVEKQEDFKFFQTLEEAVVKGDPVISILDSFDLESDVRAMVMTYLEKGETDA
jgi:predicted nucleotidyltransferase component of viral defense system